MAQYLPVLLVSVSAVSSNPAPDDSSLDTQAIGQVDYLSHDWQEEDVAKSWRNMTRRKDSIQNGARLENASWRTWWKQRNNLPTVSPETLNWLKDSDVTWLYGPLHTAADWAPPQRQSPERDGGTCSPTYLSLRSSLHPGDGLRSHAAPSNSPWSLKPILKHRSISELLSASLPPSPGSDPMELDESGYFHSPPTRAIHAAKTLREHVAPDEARKRPKLTHTRSDTNVHQRNPFRRESPPLPLGAERSRDSSCGDSTSAQATHRGRHISFNTFVEQCIAIEKPKKPHTLYEEDSFDENEEGYREDEEDSEDDEDESEDDVLEMRPTPRSRSSSSRRTPSLSGTSASTWSASGYDVSSPEREHVTIAPIAPTMLKTSTTPSPVGSWSYGSLWEEDEIEEEETLFASERTERPDSVNLVYVPPQGSVYAERMPVEAGKLSPPRVTAELRASSFDDAALLPGRRPDVTLEPPFDTSFDLFCEPDGGGMAEYSPHPAARSGRSPAQSRSSSAVDIAVEETRSRGSQGSASEDGTVVPAPVIASPPHASPIPVPRHPHRTQSPTLTPSPIPAAAPSSSSSFLEPPAPQRGRSTSPITGRDQEPSRGRSRSRGSVEGSVSPRSGSRLGRRASTSLGTSPTWRDKSLSPEECETNGAPRSEAHSKRRGSTGGLRDSASMSPPTTVHEKEERPSVQIPSGLPEPSAGDDADATRSKNPTPSNSPTSAFRPLAHAVSEEHITLAGRVVSSARGYLGSFWGGGERHPSHHQDVPVASTVPGSR